MSGSTFFKKVDQLVSELKHQFEASIASANRPNSMIHYSEKIDVSIDKTEGQYAAGLTDRESWQKVSAWESSAANTQKKSVGVNAANNVDPDKPGSGNERDVRLIAQDIIHEILHTANVKHPQDDDNNAADVDLTPIYKSGSDRKRKFDTYIPARALI